nr:sodium/glutamate symporter [Veillonella magna]
MKGLIDLSLVNGVWTLKLSMIQTVALAIVTLYLGEFIKKHSSFLQKVCMPAPAIGGLPFAFICAFLSYYKIINISFESSLQSFLMLAFFTTIGLMASLSVLKKGGIGIIIFWIVCTAWIVVQNAGGIIIAKLMGIHPIFGIMAGSVSMMGGLGTAGAFGPFFQEQLGMPGIATAAIAAATFGMVAGTLMGAPVGERIIKMHNVTTPAEDPSLLQADGIDMSNEDEESKSFTLPQLMNTIAIVGISLGLGTIVSYGLSIAVGPLPAYIGAMIVAAVIRNYGDLTGSYRINSAALDAVSNISLSIFVTMAINSLKLVQLIDLAIPLLAILAYQMVAIAVFAYLIFWIFQRNYDAVMLGTGAIGFGLGATPNALVNMLSLADKHGPSPKAWLVVSLVGAFLIDFTNAFLITFMAKML